LPGLASSIDLHVERFGTIEQWAYLRRSLSHRRASLID
jgi:hypothetical protein